MKPLKQNNEPQYLDQQPELHALIRELVEDVSQHFENTARIEDVECRSRAGFIRASDNYGGVEATSFDYVEFAVGSGRFPKSKLATAAIKRSDEQAFESACEELGLTVEQGNAVEDESTLEKLDEHRRQWLQDETIMLQYRVLYHGVDESGHHTASVSAYINWEAPYHRPSGAVYRDMGCQGKRIQYDDAKEVTVRWKTKAQAETKIRAALVKCGEAIFGGVK